jgi:hypothetical protein
MKVLLIDDDPYALELLSLQLAALGCADIVTCEHADEACRLLEREVEGVDLVINQMPCCDGVEIVRHLAGLRYAGGLVLISGEDAPPMSSAMRTWFASRCAMSAIRSSPRPTRMPRSGTSRGTVQTCSSSHLTVWKERNAITSGCID